MLVFARQASLFASTVEPEGFGEGEEEPFLKKGFLLPSPIFINAFFT